MRRALVAGSLAVLLSACSESTSSPTGPDRGDGSGGAAGGGGNGGGGGLGGSGGGAATDAKSDALTDGPEGSCLKEPVCSTAGHDFTTECDERAAGETTAYKGTCREDCRSACSGVGSLACCANTGACVPAGCGSCCGTGSYPGCGGPGKIACAPGSFCEYGYTMDRCGTSGGIGECRPIPRSAAFCVPSSMSECGCDGKTYMNRCLREVGGVSLAHAGAC